MQTTYGAILSSSGAKSKLCPTNITNFDFFEHPNRQFPWLLHFQICIIITSGLGKSDGIYVRRGP